MKPQHSVSEPPFSPLSASIGIVISFLLVICSAWVFRMAVAPNVQFIELVVPMVGVSFCTVIFAMCVQSLLTHCFRRAKEQAEQQDRAAVSTEPTSTG